MKKVFLYIASAMLFAACSSDGTQVLDIEEPPIPNPFPDYIGMVASRPNVESEGDDEPLTRSTLTYEFNQKIMIASWEIDDAIGVFPVTKNNGENIDASKSSAQQWVVDAEKNVNNGGSFSTAIFLKKDNKVATLDAGAKYVAYSPYSIGTSESNYDNISVTYRNQKQNVNVDVHAYYNRTSNDMMSDYLNSEPLASEHLNTYDYLASEAVATPTGGAHFVFTRLGSVSRFFVKVPEKAVYETMIFFNKDANFTLEATMNVRTKTLTPTATGHSLSLKLGENGFDLTSESVSPKSFNNGNAYIITYLMSAPFENLKTDYDPCTLYLLGHKDVDADGYAALDDAEKPLYEKISETCYRKKTYYKAALTKYNMEQNKVQRWSPTLGKDEPIEFEPITVQKWVEETGYTNEKGTETW